MACDCPAVSFDNSGQTDIINHLENGYLAKYKDTDDLATGIKWVIDNRESLRLDEACIRKVHDCYKESIIAKKYIALYQSLCISVNRMKEDQHIEFKESWHDEYTRYVSAFCNTQGGVLYIGLNDNGTVVGIEHPEKLIERLPNFIAQKTGIMPLVHLKESNGKEYLEIEVQPSAMPISVHGRYYTRSGVLLLNCRGIS